MAFQEGQFWAALREWRPLLEVLVHPNTLSPVGAAIHWIRSHGYSAPLSSAHRTCPPSRLWRLVPHVLAFRIALLTCTFPLDVPLETERRKQKLQRMEEVDELERVGDDTSLARKHPKSCLGNCMWMQTLPSIAQANILGFLSAEHKMFHAKDLELLAMNLLSGVSSVQLDFWVARGAQDLLSKVGCSNKLPEAKDLIKHYSVPSWLLNHKGQPALLPWMPASLCAETSSAHRICRFSETLETVVDKEKHHQADGAPTLGPLESEGMCHVDEEAREGRENEISLGTPPHLSERRKHTVEERVLSPASLNTSHDEGNDLDANKNMALEQENADCNQVGSEGGGSSMFALAHSLRAAWLERQPTPEDLHSICNLPDTVAFFKCLKPWEMNDDTILNMIKVFLKKDSGFAWSAQILSHCLLPKMLNLEQPASRFLVSAVIEAVKMHPRAAVDALLIPLVLCEKGPNKAQCDVLNRALKECLPNNHILSFCGKMFLRNRRQQLAFGNPPFVPEGFLSRSVVWSEPAWAAIQNILSRSISLDEELMEALVKVCGEEVARSAKSLKFSNLLLCLVSNFGPSLRPYKSIFQRIAEQTETFMTKSLIAKTSDL